MINSEPGSNERIGMTRILRLVKKAGVSGLF